MKKTALFILKLAAAISVVIALYRFFKYGNGPKFIDENFFYILVILLFFATMKIIAKLIHLTIFVLVILIIAGIGVSLYFGN